jgi:hypothetical protein
VSAAGWSVRELRALRGLQIEWAEPGFFITSRRNTLFRSQSLDGPFERFATLPVPLWKRALAQVRIGQRALRQLFYNVKPLADGSYFITYDRWTGVLRDGRFRPLEGLARPCRVLRDAAGIDEKGHVYFGEYLPNVERSPIRIYRYVPGENGAECVYTFPQGGVQHVHGIYPDPETGLLWCLTGDVGGECRFLRSGDGCETFEEIGVGDETWRALSPIFTPTDVYYAMDAEIHRNRVFRWERSTGEREELGELDGPVYYSVRRGDDIFFAVAAELCASQIGRNATLWHYLPGGALTPLHSVEKDLLPIQFLPGTFHFPCGPGEADRFHFSAVALKGADGRVFEVDRT